MGRYTFSAFNPAPPPRYVVLWDLHWHVLDCQRLEPATDLSTAMAAAIDRLASDGWEAEATPEYGFVFVRDNERRLLMLTPRDPLQRRAAVKCRSAPQDSVSRTDTF
jgi:hypothetical protein